MASGGVRHGNFVTFGEAFASSFLGNLRAFGSPPTRFAAPA
jgi:hypothetical protein